MKCERCGDEIEAGEEREHLGRTLCEDCYMDALSPARTCDPWAVHSAKSFPEQATTGSNLSDVQKKILAILKETGGIEPRNLVERLQIKPTDLDRDLAALRHMEKIRAELRDGRKYVILW